MSFITWSNIAGETTLGAAITSSSATTITVASGGGTALVGNRKDRSPVTGVFLAIDDEIVQVTQANSDTSLTVSRGALGTTAATHSNSAPVHAVNVASLYALIKAVAVAAAPGS